jgi:hypothetical protein
MQGMQRKVERAASLAAFTAKSTYFDADSIEPEIPDCPPDPVAIDLRQMLYRVAANGVSRLMPPSLTMSEV